MRAFKHVPNEFSAEFESGEQIKIGTFSYYRSLEGDRADPYEGLAISAPGPIVGDFSPDTPMSADQIRGLRSVGIDFGSGGTFEDLVVFGNTYTEEVPPAYLFCASAAPDFTNRTKGQVIFEITNLEAFARALAKARPDLLGAEHVRPVTYVARQVDTLHGEAPHADPFIKSPLCAEENEIRVVWEISRRSGPRQLSARSDFGLSRSF